MHLLSFAAAVHCLYAISASLAPASDLNRQRSLQDPEWPRKALSGIDYRGAGGDLAWGSMSNKDILSNSYFNSLGRSSDCFRRVAGSIRTRCAELEMNEEERVVAAISMTLCELATAKHHAPPMECDVFSVRIREGSFEQSARGESEADSRGDCVNALSRSAQFWSSYSGYLREVPQLCFTFQRENDIDNAKDIFRNISLNQELFLRMVLDREHANEVHVERWSAFFDDAAQLTDQMNLLSRRILEEASDAVEGFQRHGIETLDVLSRSLSAFRLQMENNHLIQIDKIDSALTGLSERHSRELQAIVPEFEVVLHRLLMQLFEVAKQQQEALLGELTTSVQDQWRVLYSEFSAMQAAISNLTTTTTSTAVSLVSYSYQVTEELHRAHTLVADSAHQLSNVLNTLSVTTNERMDLLDVKVEELVGKLLPLQDAWFSYESVSSERWWKGNLVRAMEFLMRGAPMSAWINSPVLKILETFWMITFWLLQRSLSTVTSFLILCLSCRKYIHRILVAPSSIRTLDDPEELAGRRVGGSFFRPCNHSYDATSLTAATTPAFAGQDSPNYKHPNSSTAFEAASTPQYDHKPTQSRIRSPCAAARSRTSRIPDRLCMPDLT